MRKAVFVDSRENKANRQKVAQAVRDSPEVLASFEAISQKFNLPMERVLADGIGHFQQDEARRLQQACGCRHS